MALTPYHNIIFIIHQKNTLFYYKNYQTYFFEI